MGFDNNASGTGCLRSNPSNWSAGWGSTQNPRNWTIDASLISPVYSNDTDTLSPDSLTNLFLIRY